MSFDLEPPLAIAANVIDLAAMRRKLRSERGRVQMSD
jgi:hypothetical protein